MLKVFCHNEQVKGLHVTGVYNGVMSDREKSAKEGCRPVTV